MIRHSFRQHVMAGCCNKAIFTTMWGCCRSSCEGVVSWWTSSHRLKLKSVTSVQIVRNALVGNGEGSCTVWEATDVIRWREEGSTGVSSKIDARCSCNSALVCWFVCDLWASEGVRRSLEQWKAPMSRSLIWLRLISTSSQFKIGTF